MKPRKNEKLWIDGLTKEQIEEAKKRLHEWFESMKEQRNENSMDIHI